MSLVSPPRYPVEFLRWRRFWRDRLFSQQYLKSIRALTTVRYCVVRFHLLSNGAALGSKRLSRKPASSSCPSQQQHSESENEMTRGMSTSRPSSVRTRLTSAAAAAAAGSDASAVSFSPSARSSRSSFVSSEYLKHFLLFDQRDNRGHRLPLRNKKLDRPHLDVSASEVAPTSAPARGLSDSQWRPHDAHLHPSIDCTCFVRFDPSPHVSST